MNNTILYTFHARFVKKGESQKKIFIIRKVKYTYKRIHTQVLCRLFESIRLRKQESPVAQNAKEGGQ